VPLFSIGLFQNKHATSNACSPWRKRRAEQSGPNCALLRRQDDALLSSQSNLDHVTRLKLGILLCYKAFPAVPSLSNDGNLRPAAASPQEQRPHQ
jgi:hypothetical protein